MGFNGKQQSHSVIGFELEKIPTALSSDLVWDCDYKVPDDGILGNYTKVSTCSCAACDSACPAPPVDSSIGFFDGFNGIIVAIVYAVLIVFSVAF